jgi:hypothetical protein
MVVSKKIKKKIKKMILHHTTNIESNKQSNDIKINITNDNILGNNVNKSINIQNRIHLYPKGWIVSDDDIKYIYNNIDYIHCDEFDKITSLLYLKYEETKHIKLKKLYLDMIDKQCCINIICKKCLNIESNILF